MADTERQLVRYKTHLERNPEEDRLLETLIKLTRIPVTLDLLQSTGIGKTVNGFRKREGEVGKTAKSLVTNWKTLVAKQSHQEKPQEKYSPKPTNEESGSEYESYHGKSENSSYNARVKSGQSKSSSHHRKQEVLNHRIKHSHREKTSESSKSRYDSDNEDDDNGSEPDERQRNESDEDERQFSRQNESDDEDLRQSSRRNESDDQDERHSSRRNESDDQESNGRSRSESPENPQSEQEMETSDIDELPEIRGSDSDNGNYDNNDVDQYSHRDKEKHSSHHDRNSSKYKMDRKSEKSYSEKESISHKSHKSHSSRKEHSKQKSGKEEMAANLFSPDEAVKITETPVKGNRISHAHKHSHKESAEKHDNKKGTKRPAEGAASDRLEDSRKSAKTEKSQVQEDVKESAQDSPDETNGLSFEDLLAYDQTLVDKALKKKKMKPSSNISSSSSNKPEQPRSHSKDKSHPKSDKRHSHSSESNSKSEKRHSHSSESNSKSDKKHSHSSESNSKSEKRHSHSSESNSKSDKKHSHSSESNSKSDRHSHSNNSKSEEKHSNSSKSHSNKEKKHLHSSSEKSKSKSHSSSGKNDSNKHSSSRKNGGKDSKSSRSSISGEITEERSPESGSVPAPPKQPIRLTDEDIMGYLPETQSYYKPLRFPGFDQDDSKHRTNVDPMLIGTKSYGRTQVYSGRKNTGMTEMLSLYDLCMRVLSDNIDGLDYVGGVPYDILKPVLEKCSAEQLYRLEDFNPQFVGETEELWLSHCNKDFRGAKQAEMESYRELYLRRFDEREVKLQKLKANIAASEVARKAPVRHTKLAYVGIVAKPPRDVRRQQMKYGTATVNTSGESSRPTPAGYQRSTLSLKSRLCMDTAPVAPRKAVKLAAPMMQKTMKMMKKLQRR